ncbi:hypothetical protein CTAYLR_006869 [Chrysophaeum taylorii]|uniref:Nuclear pore protein n=1 Tax=Chrysophaeum taylorii TaxID=2483200 RepID=A0AAD7U717_9STRA|nr:hypothetical protein CTAYLR_006869 [Chrysophaeum taylorii]
MVMMANGGVSELSTLAVDSEALLRRQVGASGIPFLQRSIEELEAENLKLLGPSSTAKKDVEMGEAPQLARAEMLSGQNFSQLQRTFEELERRAAYASPEEVGDGEDLDAALGGRAEEVVATAIEGAINDALGDAETLAAEHAAEAWKREKERLLGEMGLKALPWQDDSAAAAAACAADEGAIVAGRSGGRAALDAKDRAHGEVVRRLNEYACLDPETRESVDARGEFRAFYEFGRLESSSRSGASVAWRIGHAAAREDVRFQDVRPPDVSGSAGVAAAEATRSAARRAREGDSRADAWLARGRRNFLERLYAAFVDERRREAAETLRAHAMGAAAYEEADDACRYVALLRVRHQLPRESVERALVARGEPAWPQIYVAFRSGGPRDAVSVAEACRVAVRDPVLDRVAEALAAHAAFDLELELEGWLSAPYERARERAQARDALVIAVRALEAALDAGADDHACPYERVVLDLVSCRPDDAGPPSGSSRIADDAARREVFRTIEDYLWGELWRASFSPASSSVAASVQRFGAKHFDPAGDRPFQYANVLLHAGAPEAAIAYLAASRLPSEALHLALALDSYGLLFAEPSRAVAAAHNKKAKLATECSRFDFPRALDVYARHVAAADPALGLEYVAWRRHRANLVDDSPDEDLLGSLASFDEVGFLDDRDVSLLGSVISLVLGAPSLDDLAGTLDVATLERDATTAALDRHFRDSRLVERVLAVAARVSRARGDHDDAIDLLVLAGDDVAVIDLFSDHLARVVSKPDAKRRADWLKRAADYARTRLETGPRAERVLLALKSANKHDVGHAFQTLLNLADFFDKCDDKRYDQALHLLDQPGLRLLPATQSDLATLLDAAPAFDPRVHKVFPDVLVRAMDCLYALHQRARDLSRYPAHHHPPDQTKDARNATRLTLDPPAAIIVPRQHQRADRDLAADLRRRAALLVNFAGLVKIRLPPDVKTTLSRYEAMMM